MSTHRTRKPGREGQEGIALVMGLMGIAILLMVASSALMVGGSSIRATRNYRSASQAHFVAESGISHALQVIDGPGVIHFQNDVVNNWAAMFGTASKTFAPLGGFTYTVSVAAGANPANNGRIVATASGPEGSRNVVVANVIRSNTPSTSPGAIYLSTDQTSNSTFNGNAWQVDGNDHNYTGGMGPGAPVPGLSTRNDTNTQEALGSLNSAQMDNVTGLGYSVGPPITPSVKTSPAAPTTAQLNQMITDLLAKPGVVVNNNNSIEGNQVMGTTLIPQITYFSNDQVEIKANGNVSGAGIMIINGDLTIKGNLNFKGLILVKGRTNVVGDTEVTGNATIYGSIWTNDVSLVVGGSAIVNYSTQALALANNVAGGGALPSPVIVTSLADCSQVPTGTGGCP